MLQGCRHQKNSNLSERNQSIIAKTGIAHFPKFANGIDIALSISPTFTTFCKVFVTAEH